MPEPLKIRTFTSGVFGENAYLVRSASTGEWVAIDPGAEAETMARELEASGESLRAILLTHAHLDHMEGVADLVDHVPAPIYLHPADRPLYDAAPQQAAMFGHSFRAPPTPDEALAHGQAFRFGDRVLEVRHVPGHSPGHVLFHDAAAGVAFVGDVVFRGSIGRTDLPGGDSRQLLTSIREQVLSLPDETVLYTGHGDPTTVERERTTNPFLAPNMGGGLA